MRVGYSFDRDRLLGRFDETVRLTGLENISDVAKDIVIDLCVDPFIKQAALAEKYSLTKDELLEINNNLRDNQSVQKLITEYGP